LGHTLPSSKASTFSPAGKFGSAYPDFGQGFSPSRSGWALYHYSLWEAASSSSTQAFMLIGTLFLLPIILMYTGWSYWVFRGKTSETLGYH
jgi:cytochrome bd-type quinol oxidase subunit 2